MTRLLARTFFVFILFGICGIGQLNADQVFYENFDDGTYSDWSITGTTRINSQYALGSYSVRLSGNASISRDVSTEGYADVSVTMHMAASGQESGDYAYAEVSIDGGNTWTALITLTNGQDNGNFYSSTAVPAGIDDNPNVVLRFRTAQNSQRDYGYADTVVVEGTPTGSNPAPEITVSPASLSFGSVAVSGNVNQDVNVANDGSADLLIGNIDSLVSPFSIISDTCSDKTLSPNSGCVISVSFAPVETGDFSDTFDIPSNDADEANVTVSVSGTGTQASTLYDPLNGNGNVSRSLLTYADMMSSSQPGSLVDNSAFAPPANAANPDHIFEGTLDLTVNNRTRGNYSKIYDPYNYDGLTSMRRMPDIVEELVQHGTWIIPVHRGLRQGGWRSGTGSYGWDYHLLPGRVWKENTDNGYSRAVIPFALNITNENCTANGLLTFLFNDSGISHLRYQVASETCLYYQINMFGQLSASYTPHSVSGATAIRSDFEVERADRIPIKPYSDLTTEFGVNTSNFSANVEAEGDMSGKAVYYNDYIYMWPCSTRAGDDPYCEYHLFPSYSTAKTTLASVALLKIAQDQGQSVFDLKTGDYIPGEPSTYSAVTWNQSIDMATGHYDSTTTFDTDEGGTNQINFLNARDNNAKMTYAFNYPYKAVPGTVPVYHSSDTYLLFKAMETYIGTDLFDHVKTNVYAPLKIEADSLTTLRTWENGGWSNGSAVGGYGMWWTHDSIAKIAKFLNQDAGKINGTQVLNANRLNATLQRDAGDRGMDLSGYSGYGSIWYNNGTWAYKYIAGNTYTNGQVYSCDWYLPYMVGYGGINVLLGPNNVNYWYFSDAGLAHWGDAVTEMNKINPFCN